VEFTNKFSQLPFQSHVMITQIAKVTKLYKTQKLTAAERWIGSVLAKMHSKLADFVKFDFY